MPECRHREGERGEGRRRVIGEACGAAAERGLPAVRAGPSRLRHRVRHGAHRTRLLRDRGGRRSRGPRAGAGHEHRADGPVAARRRSAGGPDLPEPHALPRQSAGGRRPGDARCDRRHGRRVDDLHRGLRSRLRDGGGLHRARRAGRRGPDRPRGAVAAGQRPAQTARQRGQGARAGRRRSRRRGQWPGLGARLGRAHLRRRRLPAARAAPGRARHRHQRAERPTGRVGRILVADVAVDLYGRRDRPRRRMAGRVPVAGTRRRGGRVCGSA